jgi:lipopolysaccharide transport system ATP-binding protein
VVHSGGTENVLARVPGIMFHDRFILLHRYSILPQNRKDICRQYLENMPNPIISIEHVSKKFIISHEAPERYKSLRDTMANKVKNMVGRGRKRPSLPNEEFYALQDINVEVYPGDRLGIIGRNGAGKSTLLKILSRITEPSAGRITIRGRVASLLEVGTGFHPELTGRENIFLNGAILGMGRAEIRKKFDEIVDFAEIEKFLDTPVKRYSSGMYVRLAFAVAAHLEPEILIVDEVLAVGDAEFQKKCIGKMKDVSEGGRTVLFVSHNTAAISSLCTKGILLKNGKITASGDINKVVNDYQLLFSPTSKTVFEPDNKYSGNEKIHLNFIELEYNDKQGGFLIDEPLTIKVGFTNKEIVSPININLFFNAPDGTNIFATCSTSKIFDKGIIVMKCKIPANFFNDNVYTIDIMAVTNSEAVLEVKETLVIEGFEPPRDMGWLGKFPGFIRPSFEWLT